ncbi:MAG: tetratricopeptide repeat protein [Candidatus Hatepunaea meridiana]|nr:tetratricopeptide repeat protein [Candidatus Hatepunaea meridiana]
MKRLSKNETSFVAITKTYLYRVGASLLSPSSMGFYKSSSTRTRLLTSSGWDRHSCLSIPFLSILLLLSIFILPPTLSAGNQDLLFQAGSKAYLDGDWGTALKHWQQIETSGYQGSALYYNMGNAYFKTGVLGKAILYWEKAARLMGEDDDLSANLQIARSRLVDKLDESVNLPVWDWLDRLRARFSSAALSYLSIGFCILMFGLIALRRWLIKNITIKKWILLPVWILLILLIFDLSLLTLKARDDLTQREGILLINEAEVLSAPAQGTGKLLFTLHEGTKVRVFRELEGWYEVSAGKDRLGWVKKGALGII